MAPRSGNKGVRISLFKEAESGPKKQSHDYVHYTVPVAASDKFSINSSTITTEGGLNHPVESHLAPVLCLEPPASGSEGESNNVDADELSRMNKGKGDEALHDFMGQMDLFLTELMNMDGRGPFPTDTCPNCMLNSAQYECLDCFGRTMLCSECTVKKHASLYLHRIQKWEGSFFRRSSLKELGLRVQLGHPLGISCPNPDRCREDDFTVIDVHGIHSVSIDFCACGNLDQRRTVQLLRARIFPATIKDPRSGATFRTLGFFEMLAYEAKTSAYELFQTIARCTDNTGTVSTKDRYHALLRMLREWRHLRMLKRSGRGYDPRGVAATGEGECAVLCPACPQPGRNMAPDWKTDGRPRFLHQLFISIDACFRQKRKNISSDDADPGLIHGFAYFVSDKEYKEYLERHKTDVEPKSSCSRHDAVNMSEKSNQGYAATGISAVVCSRHDMKRPTSVGDLQRGERYCNMDYVVRSSLRGAAEDLGYITIGYDIVCQWETNFRERMFKEDPAFFLLNDNVHVRFLVPKFHLPAHVSQCRLNYSYNLTAHTGRTDGEATERGWVYLNGLAPSAREMGPGSRRDTLDYHIGDENWRKVTDMGASLAAKLHTAALDMAEHVIAHDEFTKSIPLGQAKEWTDMIVAWNSVKHNKKTTTPNPYEVASSGPSEASVRRELAEEERRDIEAGRDMSLDDKVTASILIATGLDLEREQRALKVESKKIWDHSLDRQQTRLILRANALQRKIDAWTHYLTVYIPGVSQLQEALNSSSRAATSVADATLFLPSTIVDKVPVNRRLCIVEFRLRHSQAHEALDQLQTQLQLKAHLLGHKLRNIVGQGPNTRMRLTIDGVQARINQHVVTYRTAYNALIALTPYVFEVGWKKDLLPLEDDDVRALSEGRKKRKNGETESEGTRVISWIWRKNTAGADESNSEFMKDRLRSEWCKSAARAERFKEEVALLGEEMVRVWRFFGWQEDSWMSKVMQTDKWPTPLDDMQIEGMKAYAHRQADMYHRMRNHAQSQWASLNTHVTRMQAIIANPDLMLPGEFDKSSSKGSKSMPFD